MNITHTDPDQEVQARTTALFFRNILLGQVMGIFLSLLLTIVAETSSPFIANLWVAVTVVLAIVRLAVGHWYQSSAPDQKSDPKWTRLATIGAAASGLAWSIGCFIFMWHAPEPQQYFVAFLIAGVVAGAVPVLSPIPIAFQLFSSPAICAVCLFSLLQAKTNMQWTLGISAALFQVVMFRACSAFSEVLNQSIRLGVEQNALVAELSLARDEALASSRAKSGFLATVSHEIRTPMNGILGMAQLLLMPGLKAQERQEYVQTILNSGNTLLTLLNDFLDLSKVEAGKLQLKFAVFQPRQIIHETQLLFTELAKTKDIRVTAAWHGAQDLHFESDPVRLRQMLSNLVSNAIKFTAQGSVTIDGRELSREDGQAVIEFSVTDTGIGIPTEKQDLLFQPFSQVDSSDTREYGGTGLGLSIVRNYAELMGGEVGIESMAGQGARFWFRVKVRVVADEAARNELPDIAAATKPAAANTPAADGVVLIVDDNATNRKLIEALMRKQDIKFQSVENGEQALQFVTSRMVPALILMDCQMPVMDGYTATEKIRQWERDSGLSPLPIIALSAGAFQEDIDRCIKVGMNDFLAKPIQLNTFVATLNKWLGSSNQAN